MTSLTLYKWRAKWELPSVSPACLEIEALLRLTGRSYSTEECTSPATSPTGQLPSLEGQTNAEDQLDPWDDERAATACRQALADDVKKLDEHLSPAQKALQIAFGALVRQQLAHATQFSMWCEPLSYQKHTRGAFAGTMPFPLNYLLPWRHHRRVASRTGHLSPEQVYEGAAAAYEALDHQLQGQGPYLFGEQPCSLDAALLAQLAFHKHCPASAPELRALVERHGAVSLYLSRLLPQLFSTPAAENRPITDEEWGRRAEAAASSGPQRRKLQRLKEEEALKEQMFHRRSQQWVGAALFVVASYFVITGGYHNLDFFWGQQH